MKRPSSSLRSAWHAVVDTAFPTQCHVTHAPIDREQLGLCDEVRRKIAHSLAWPYCTRCGATSGLYTDHRRYRPCPRCAVRDLGVQAVVRVGTFDAPLSDLILHMKFGKRWQVARVLAPFVWQAVGLYRTRTEAPLDMLVPVPLHWRRRWSRGFNQSEELAREVAKLGHWPVKNVLRRRRSTHQQSTTQSISERRENLKDAFACVPGVSLSGQHVWLVDDVCTTGATLHAAAAALKRLPPDHRPASIHAMVVCVTDQNAVPDHEALPAVPVQK